ncbi:MAG: GNAT family N-acetyltransferase [Nakamurella sp.]
MLMSGSARILTAANGSEVARVLASDPVASCLVAARFEQAGMDSEGLGGQFWGLGGGRDGVCFDGANLVPLSGDKHAVKAFAHAASRAGRRCASILGAAELVLPLWDRLSGPWGPAREVRPDQPLLACTERVQCAVDPMMQAVSMDAVETYYPASVAMFTEEVGVDPRRPDGGVGYRTRVEELIKAGRSFARIENGAVVVKAEIGAVSSRAALIQGVWVAPEHRGAGLAAPAVAAVVAHIHRMRRIPSLYVNSHNVSARAAYQRVGFRQVGTFASVLF